MLDLIPEAVTVIGYAVAAVMFGLMALMFGAWVEGLIAMVGSWVRRA